MEVLFSQLVAMLAALWWPFCRILAAFSAAPMLGDAAVPISVRVLLSVVLAVAILPAVEIVGPIEPWSMQGITATIEQVAIGAVLGFTFHLIVSSFMVLGYLISSQMGLAMAVMNDPMSGASSDVVSVILYVLCMLVFFSVDGHLVFAGVIGASFKAWPVGAGLSLLSLHALALNVAWVFSAALLMAVPIIFSALVVQMGFGFLNRVAPTLNLFALGFSLVTMFGVYMLSHIVRTVPEHYLRMMDRVLDTLQQTLRAVPHG